MSELREEVRQLKLRIAVLLARGREARARAAEPLERGRALRERRGDHHRDVSALIARSNHLAPPRAPVRAPDDD